MVYNITIFRYIAILEQFKKKENIKRGRTGNFHTKKLTREKKRSCYKEEYFTWTIISTVTSKHSFNTFCLRVFDFINSNFLQYYQAVCCPLRYVYLPARNTRPSK